MKNIFVEGIQGSGKSTLVNNIYKSKPGLNICREGDYCPVDLAWCAYMSKEEYEAVLEKYSLIKDDIVKNTVIEQEHYIVSYTKIITDIPGFHKDFENYEVYNGRKSWNELKCIILTRFRNFIEAGYLFECSFFQNIMEDLMLFHMLSDDEIIEFYGELFKLIDKEKFMLIYLMNDNLEESINIIKKERSDEEGNELWYDMMLGYLADSPYGRRYGLKSFEDLVNHFKHRQELELTIIREVIGENAVVLRAKDYDMEQVMSQINILEIRDGELGCYGRDGGNFVAEQLNTEKTEATSCTIRPITTQEYSLLDNFLYEAIFIPEGVEAPPKDIIKAPELQVYVESFGTRDGDICFVAEISGKVVGAVWVRIMDDYGHVEDGVPSFAISLYKKYRGCGIGTELMKRMLAELQIRGYKKASLAVQKENYAVRMYKKVGFEIIDENDEEYIMMWRAKNGV